ncbi:PucR family transcriptional regulator [Microtetraspora niveoalba]|uniref:PucR family transcriptional regulator n=1 Tax=Microtetraspora niveoalba TaxID=46175 RepID=UPI000836185A|nr:PucR family transcriptional regulator [Microtetraspora niveoalba]
MLLRDLLAVEELRLTLLSGDADREIGGVLVTDLPDPGRYVSPGDLVLTGLMWRRDAADSEAFADALVASGVAALGAGDARLGLVPDDLTAACGKRGLPLFEVPVEVSFAAIADVVNRRLSGARAGDLRRALGRHRRIVAAVAEGAGLGRLFALMASELGVAGAVLSASGSVIAGDLPEEHAVRLAGEALRATRLPRVVRPGGPKGGDAAPYTIFAVDRAHRAAGWVLACRGELDVEVGYELASCVAMERARMEEGRRVERRLAEELIGLAVSGRADLPELSARLRTCGIEAAEPYAAVAATMTATATATATAAAAGTGPGAAAGGPDPVTLGGQVVEELLDRRAVAAAGAEGAVALVPLRGHGTAAALAARLRERVAVIASGLPRARVCVGVSAGLAGAAAIRGGAEEAGYARRMAELRGGGVVTSDEIYTHGLLLATVPDRVRRSFASRLLDPLVDYDRRHRAELTLTLGTFLDCAGSWNACAERLHVHVNTVRYRIRRIEELTGKDLSSMADRVDLFLALRAG